MSGTFFIPIATMLAGLGTWTAWVIAHAVSDTVEGLPPYVAVGLALVAGGLIAFSAFT